MSGEGASEARFPAKRFRPCGLGCNVAFGCHLLRKPSEPSEIAVLSCILDI